jgi:hypothetical protein
MTAIPHIDLSRSLAQTISTRIPKQRAVASSASRTIASDEERR